ncbi:MAG: hypothetical protein K8J08_06855 [Thermoanaerobaculia bacterium]|nr:hypothetical protein [Thermoanaerobaculia bacterium]
MPLHRPEAMSSPRWIKASSLPVSLLTVTAILFWRKPDAFLNPQFWAEDGVVFFQQAYIEGSHSLVVTYSGYFHLIPRLVAWFVEAAPYRFAPAFYNLAGLGGMWAVVAMLHSPRLRLPVPSAYALVPVLVPHLTGEVFVSLTNVQWPLALLLLLTVLQEPPQRLLPLLGDVLIIVLVGLTTPLIVLLVPFLTLRAYLHRSWRLGTEAAMGWVIASLQLLAFRQNPTFVPPSPGYEPSSWIELLGHKTIGTLFLGNEVPYQHSPLMFVVIGGLLGGLAVWRLCAVGSLGTRFTLPSLLFGLLATGAAFYKFRHAVDLLVPAPAAVRYFYVLWVIACWALITLVLKDGSKARVPAALMLAIILHSSFTTTFRTPPLRDFRWKSYEARLEAKEHLRIPVNPRGWRIEVNKPTESSAHQPR